MILIKFSLNSAGFEVTHLYALFQSSTSVKTKQLIWQLTADKTRVGVGVHGATQLKQLYAEFFLLLIMGYVHISVLLLRLIYL